MPLFGFRLTTSLCGIEADQPLPCNIKKGIEGLGPFIAKRRFIGSFQPGLHVPFSYPGPWILAVQLHRLVEIRAGFLDLTCEAAPMTAFGISDGHQTQIGLTSDDERFSRLWIQLGSLGGELDFLPEVRSLKRSVELLSGAYHRFRFSAGLNHEHASAFGLLLQFFQLGAEMQVFLLKLTKMFR